MIHPIVIDGDPVLRRPAARIETFDDSVQELVADMFETLAASNGVGLAAPQIGVSKRVFVFDAPDEDEQRSGVLINPTLQIVQRPPRFAAEFGPRKKAPKFLNDNEGCLSFPGPDFELKRFYAVLLRGFDQYGQPVEVAAEDWFARVLQHEYDHLDGYLYVDRLKGRAAAKAKALSQENGWGVPGLTWMPGVDPDPFAHNQEADDEFGGETEEDSDRV